jgi:hypothetical protein
MLPFLWQSVPTAFSFRRTRHWPKIHAVRCGYRSERIRLSWQVPDASFVLTRAIEAAVVRIRGALGGLSAWRNEIGPWASGGAEGLPMPVIEVLAQGDQSFPPLLSESPD